METNKLIEKFCDEFKEKLLEKNRLYGDSLQNSKVRLTNLDNSTKILSRLEDKFNRFVSVGLNDDTEDSLEDAFGYYIHYKIAKFKEKSK